MPLRVMGDSLGLARTAAGTADGRARTRRVDLRQDGRMRIHIGSDHAGFELKSALVEHLRAAGHDVVDHGAHTYDAHDDYPPFCFETGEAVVADPGLARRRHRRLRQRRADRRQQGGRRARRARVEPRRPPSSRRQHNDANVVAVGARQHSVDEAIELVDAFVAEPFSGDPRHQRRIDLLTAYEDAR